MNNKELLKFTPGELVDLGICPTCFNKKHSISLSSYINLSLLSYF